MEDVNPPDDSITDKYEKEKSRRKSMTFRGTIPNPESKATSVFDSDEDGNRKEESRGVATDMEELHTYMGAVNNEIKAWRQIYKQRKKETKILSLQKSSLEQTGGEAVNISILSDEDKTFLSNRPDYEQICEKVHELKEYALKMASLNEHTHYLHDTYQNQVGDILTEATRSIIRSIK